MTKYEQQLVADVERLLEGVYDQWRENVLTACSELAHGAPATEAMLLAITIDVLDDWRTVAPAVQGFLAGTVDGGDAIEAVVRSQVMHTNESSASADYWLAYMEAFKDEAERLAGGKDE